ncbi:hypothetical protein [Streptomyces sp. NPDC059957]|uniref:hypothetical protein n=1 Tax=Streptomyces sp. NPDC059957 TaxID=3347016 RepID=UPI003654B405
MRSAPATTAFAGDGVDEVTAPAEIYRGSFDEEAGYGLKEQMDGKEIEFGQAERYVEAAHVGDARKDS